MYSSNSIVLEIQKLARSSGLIDPKVEQLSGMFMLTRRIVLPTVREPSQPVVYASGLSLEMLGHNVWTRLGRDGLLE